MRMLRTYTVFISLFGLILASYMPALGADEMVVTESGNVGIGEDNPMEKLVVNGLIRSNKHIIYHPSMQLPSDLWGGPYLMNYNSFIGHMGNNALNIMWNGYRRYSDSQINVLGINDSDTVNCIRLQDSGIAFESQDEMVDGSDWPARRMFISNNGNVGIGSATPQHRLSIYGGGIQLFNEFGIGFNGEAPEDGDVSSDRAKIYYEPALVGTANDFLIIEKSDANSADPDGGIAFTNKGNDNVREVAMVIRGSGNVGIGTLAPSEKLHVAGNIKVDGTVIDGTDSSDARLKEHVETITDALYRISQLRGVSFNWIDNSKGTATELGVIAQEVETVFPELVRYDSDGYRSVDYKKIVAPLIEAVKELKVQNEQLVAENQALKSGMQDILYRLDEIENH